MNSMKISPKSKIGIFIVITLFLAIFNDIIRVPDTTLSAYRLMLPAVFCIVVINFNITWKYFFFMIGMSFLLALQNIIFCKVLKFESSIDTIWQIKYSIHYFSIITVFMLLRVLRKKNSVMFENIFLKGIPFVGGLCILAFIGAWLNPFQNIHFTNVNDYGACLAAVFPWLFIELKRKRKNLLFCAAILIVLWLGDSKCALAGILIQVSVISSVMLIKKIKQGNRVLIFIVPIVIALCLLIALSPVRINDYPIRDMFIDMSSHIIKGEVYNKNNSSLKYRTNAIIYMLYGMKQSWFMGIGIGNTGKMLGYLMSDLVIKKNGRYIDYISSLCIIRIFL